MNHAPRAVVLLGLALACSGCELAANLLGAMVHVPDRDRRVVRGRRRQQLPGGFVAGIAAPIAALVGAAIAYAVRDEAPTDPAS